MANFLVYWKTFWSDYGPLHARQHVLDSGYSTRGAGFTHAIRDDNVWVVGRSQNNYEWRLLQKLVVIEDSINDEGAHRVRAHPTDSCFFLSETQSDFESQLKRLEFRSGKPITHSGASIGMQIQNIRPLTKQDSILLESYSDRLHHLTSVSLPEGVNEEAYDDSEEVVYARREQLVRVRNAANAREVKGLYNYQCQRCGTILELPSGRRYAEAHHIVALGRPHEGPDRIENMLCLCPNCHLLLDKNAKRINVNEFEIAPRHRIDPAYVEHHNELCERVVNAD